MFKNAATKLAHNSTIPSLGGNSDLRPLQDLITSEKTVLNSIQRLSSDLVKASDALRTWGLGEGDDLGDTLSASTSILEHFAKALMQYASLHNTVRDNMKAVRTREESLDELKRRRRRVVANADSAERKLNKMSPEHKNLTQQTELLNRLREEIRGLDTDIMDEEANLGDYKRKCTKNWMTLKFGGLVECCEKGVIIGNTGKNILVNIPEGQTQPGLPRAFYNGHTHVNSLLNDCTNKLEGVVFSGVPSSYPEGNPFGDGTNVPESPHTPGIPGQSPYGTPTIGGGSNYAPYMAGRSVTTVTNPDTSVDEMGVGTGGGPASMSAIPRHGPAPSIDTQSQFSSMPIRGARGPGGFYNSNSTTPTASAFNGGGGGGPRPSLGERPPQMEDTSFSHSVAEAFSLRGDPNTASSLARAATNSSMAHDEPVPQYEPYDVSALTGGGGGIGGGAPYDGLPPGAAPAAVPAWGHAQNHGRGQGVSLADGRPSSSGSPTTAQRPASSGGNGRTSTDKTRDDGLGAGGGGGGLSYDDEPPRRASRHIVFGQTSEDDQQPPPASPLSIVPPRSASLATGQGQDQEQADTEPSPIPTPRDEHRLSRVPPPSAGEQEYAPPSSRRNSTVPSSAQNQNRNQSPLASPQSPSEQDGGGLKSLNAEAARSIAEEIDALSSEPPPSVLRSRPRAGSASTATGGAGGRGNTTTTSPPRSPTSPLAPPTAPFAQRAVSPGNDNNGGGAGGAPAGGRPLPNPSPLASPLSSSPKLGALPTFSVHSSTPGNSPYRTPPEYPGSRPFGGSSPYTRSTSSLTSPTSGGGAGGAKMISAAAFRRPQGRMPSGSEPPLPGVPPPSASATAGGGSPGTVHQQFASSPADTSPLTLRGKTSGHMRHGGGGSSVGGSQALPPGASPGPGPQGRPMSGAASEEDFDYISAYVNGQENGPGQGQHQGQGQGGYDQGRFATNLEDDVR